MSVLVAAELNSKTDSTPRSESTGIQESRKTQIVNQPEQGLEQDHTVARGSIISSCYKGFFSKMVRSWQLDSVEKTTQYWRGVL